uniref:Uncharacterized protein n=1 Tax=Anopheles atroparvus TaxID=41427 RepID=A0A182JLN3_ANOAO
RRKHLQQVLGADGVQAYNQQDVQQVKQFGSVVTTKATGVHHELADRAYDSSTSASEVDAEFLPQGDNSLPWRRSRSLSRGPMPAVAPWRRASQDRRTSRDRSLSIDKREEVKPWTAEVIKLKKTAKERKTIEKEKLETVLLKPTQIQKPQVKREELAKVELKAVKREQQEITEQHMEEMVEAIISEQLTEDQVDYNVHKLRHDEDSSILQITQQVDELIRKEEQKGVPWHRGGTKKSQKPVLSKEQFVETDEATRLTIGRDETIQEKREEQQLILNQEAGVAWRRGKRPEPKQAPFAQVEDSATLSVDRLEEQEEQPRETKPIEQPVAWRRGAKEKPPTATEQAQEEQPQVATEKAQPQDTELPPWMRGRKPGPKRELQIPAEPEKVEQVMLKPTPRVKKELAKESVEEVSLKPVPKKPITAEVPHVEDAEAEETTVKLIKKKKPKPKQPELESYEKMEFTPTDVPAPEKLKLPEKLQEEKPLKPEQEPEQGSWRRQQKPRTEVEVSEEKQWPTGKRHPLLEEPKEDVVLKPIPKPTKEVEPKLTEELQITPKPLPEVVDKREPEQTPLVLEKPTEPAEDESLPPWRRGKKPVQKKELPKPVEVEQVEKVELKPTRRERKEIPKESLEEVALKPVPKPVKEAELEQEQQAIITPVPMEPTSEVKKKKKVPKVTPKPVEEEAPKEVEIAEVEPVVIAPEPKAEVVEPAPETKEPEDDESHLPPWRRGRKEVPKREIPKEEQQVMETVTLKPTPKKANELPQESLEEVSLKPV